KNLTRLLQAFRSITDRIPHHLVIAGQSEGFLTGDEKIAAEAASLKNRVHLTGALDQARLEQYMIHAEALVFPSLYEGFGLPPLEAMACGCPVLTSQAAALPEVCGDAALYADPYHVEDLAEKMVRITLDKAMRGELREKGLRRAHYFSWEKSAEATL